MSQENIHPVFDRLLGRDDKQRLLGQRSVVVWLYGLSGSGKSTIANLVERALHEDGRMTQILDGDNIRSGLNQNLGFSDEDRLENIRRISEVAKLLKEAGVVTLASFITPKKELREMARSIVGAEDFIEVYVKASFEECARRDVKGLYAKAAQGGVKQFTGKDSGFEEPEGGNVIILDTESESAEDSAKRLLTILRERVQPTVS
ncbi:adenylyl-sulfate kinase [Puniceicoccus vermicola]|uniref:Adenylyl-sulfate kinase n=1 Tax=Puniceicoccus vermicola TaxID=388746 RepID=A0A7X1AXU0_9BACT|nr:adenylyl-sulfate kinase [Puniceicoccus vermicola]MBC2600943.1 adenylyl-sulfate kinase [Puniceicoccus vermicola]